MRNFKSNTKSYSKWKNISDEKRINGEIKLFYKTLFKENIEKISTEHALFSGTFLLPILNKIQGLLGEGDLLLKKIYVKP